MDGTASVMSGEEIRAVVGAGAEPLAADVEQPDIGAFRRRTA